MLPARESLVSACQQRSYHVSSRKSRYSRAYHLSARTARMIRDAVAIYRAIERRPDAGTDEVLSAILRDWRKNVPRRAANAGLSMAELARLVPASADRPASSSGELRSGWGDRRDGPNVE